MTEEWREIAEFRDVYEVSNLGKVRGLPRLSAADGRRLKGKILTSNLRTADGRPFVDLFADGKKHRRVINKMVLEAFTGSGPEGAEVNHVDGDRENCKLSNLRWGTHSQNLREAYGRGLMNTSRRGDGRYAPK